MLWCKKNKYSSLELIDEVYKCVYPNDYKINFSKDFNFDNIFVKVKGNSPKTTSTINLTSAEKENPVFTKIILNKYFSGVVKGDDGKYYLPRFGSLSETRAKTVNENDFKDGDVLIYYITNSSYTTEEGLYAYIYINGKFIGINGEGTTVRNEFTHDYYSSSYTNLYEGYNKLTEENKDEVLTFINYQTLYGKDYYSIFRPTLSFEYEEEIVKVEEKNEPEEKKEEIENPNTGNDLKYSVITVLLMISLSIYFAIRKKTKFKKHC